MEEEGKNLEERKERHLGRKGRIGKSETEEKGWKKGKQRNKGK